MLSRVANNLYWMGRSIERAEHLSRYTREMYFASLDAPIDTSSSKTFVLDSMLYMAGIFDMTDKSEQAILHKIGIDSKNPNSILSNITTARENARGVRNTISTNLWEAINKLYHYTNSDSTKSFPTTGLYGITRKILDQISIIKSTIHNTLLDDETKAIIMLGMYMERVNQTIRIINSKLNDIHILEQSGIEVNKLSFEWSTLLRCTESFDMNKKFYGNIPEKNQVLEFLILNIQCPKSISYCLKEMEHYFSKISYESKLNKKSLDFKINKLQSQFRYLTIEEVGGEGEVYGLLNFTQEILTDIGKELNKKYFAQ